MASATKHHQQPAVAGQETRRSAAAIADLSLRGERLGGLASLARDGPAIVAQRQRLQGMFGPAPVQRKVAAEAGDVVTGLTATAETRTTVGPSGQGGGLTGKIYSQTLADLQPDQATAIKAAAIAGGAVGGKLDTWGRSGKVGKKTGKGWAPPQMFTLLPDNLNKAEIATVDPFFHRVILRYGSDPDIYSMTLVWQHGPALQGYIAAIQDTGGSTAVSGGANMYHGKSNKKHTVGPYDDHHAETQGANILAKAKGTGVEARDAYTKLAGEGARWVCVRDNIATLTDYTYFYTANPKDEQKPLTVRFDELWVGWADPFGKRYNIPNATVIEMLVDDRIGGPTPIAKIPDTSIKL